jgi:hypothetical protein
MNWDVTVADLPAKRFAGIRELAGRPYGISANMDEKAGFDYWAAMGCTRRSTRVRQRIEAKGLMKNPKKR